MIIARHLLKALVDAEMDLSQIEEKKSTHPFFGLMLSVASALLVGGSFILQKKGLIRSTAQMSNRGKQCK